MQSSGGSAAAASASPHAASKKSKSSHRKTNLHDATQAGAAAAATPAPFAAAAAASSSAASALAATPRFVHPLHRCRFHTVLPHAIISLAFSHSGRLLALGRSNGNIEIWAVGANPAHTPHQTSSHAAQGGINGWVLIKTIPGSGEATVQCIMWARAKGAPERLFSAGLNGRLIEWDLTGLAPRYASDTYGGAVWSGAIQETTIDGSSTITIALGCEDGTIRLFDVSDATAPPLYNKALSRHSSRILSVAWSPDANFLASGGSDGMIKLWDLRNDGRNILRITVENKGLRRTTLAEASEPGAKPNPRTKKHLHSDAERYTTYVWSLVFLTGSTLISGDSLGNLAVWELEFGTLRQHFPKALQGDVLSIVRNKTGDALYASGVEGKIVELRKVSMSVDKEGLSGSASASTPAPVEEDESTIKWILTANHRQHTHDVYALAISPNTLPVAKNSGAGSLGSPKLHATPAPLPNNYLLVSGGVDTQLLLSPTTCFPDYNSLTRLLPFPQSRGGVCVADQIIAPQAEDKSDDDEDSEDASSKSTPAKKLPARFLISHDQHLQLYSLGEYAYETTADKLRNREMHTQEHDTLPLDKSYTHLLDINVNSRKSVDTSNPSASIWVPGGGLNLLCSALSSNSRYIACSDPLQVKLYEITTKAQRTSANQQVLSVKKIKNVSNLVNPANVMCFSADSTRLFLGTLAGAIQILDLTSLDEDEPRVQTLEEHVPQAVYEGDLSSSDEDDEAMDGGKRKQKKAASQRKQKLGVLRCLAVSHDQQYLCLSDEHSKAWIYELDTLRLAATLPAFSESVLALEFHPSNASTLAVLCARNTLYLYDVEAQKMTEYSKHNLGAIATGQAQSAAAAAAAAQSLSSAGNLLSPASHLLSREQFTHLSWDRSVLSNGNSLLLQSLGLLCHINLDRPRPTTGPTQLLTGAAAQAALSATHHNRRDRKRKAEGLEEAAAAAASGATDLSASSSSAAPLDPRQVNFRVITRFKPMLYAGFIDESDGVSHAFKNTQHATAAAENGKKKRKKDAATEEAVSSNGAAAAAAAASSSSDDPSLVRPVVVGSSLLVIEAPWVNILQQLPQPLARHRYGT